MSSLAFPPTEPPPELPERPEGAESARARTGTAAWSPVTAFFALPGVFMAALVSSVVAFAVAAAAGTDVAENDLPPGALLAGNTVQFAGFVAVAVLLARLGGRTSAAQFGLRRPVIWRAVLIMLGVYFAYGLFTGLWAQIVDIESAREQLDSLGVDSSTAALIAAALLVCVVAPIAEEILFRGFIFSALRNWRGVWPAALITGLLFGAFHLFGSPVGALLPLAFLGAGLCLLYAWTGSLLPCIALHAINNALAFGTTQKYDPGVVALMVVGALLACLVVVVPLMRFWREPAPGPVAAPATAPA